MYGGEGVYETAVSWECVCVCEKKEAVVATCMYVCYSILSSNAENARNVT